jgi:hypothetical protein
MRSQQSLLQFGKQISNEELEQMLTETGAMSKAAARKLFAAETPVKRRRE